MTTHITLSPEKQNFLVETSNDLARAKAEPVHSENIDSFEHYCDHLAKTSRKAGFPIFATLANSCRKLASAFRRAETAELRDEAAYLLREGFYTLHGCLHKIVVDGELQASRLQFVKILSRSQRFLEKVPEPKIAPPVEKQSARVEVSTDANQEKKIEQKKTPGHLVFRLNGRRYAISVEALISVGKITTRDWISKNVLIEEKPYPLKDLKRELGIYSEAGTLYIALKTRGRIAAWAVDGIEGIRRSGTLTYHDLNTLARPAGSLTYNLIRGMLKEKTPAPPILLIHTDQLQLA